MHHTTASDPGEQAFDLGVRPSRVRFGVLTFLCALIFILYLDRVCISQAVVSIQEELHLSNSQMGIILMAFTLGYGLFEIPTGYWGDRFGSRVVLTRIAVWWSMFTVLTAFCVGFYSLVVVRFLFGAGEAGAFPNTARIIARWFPAGERGRVQGFVLASAMIGGTVAPVLAGYMIHYAGWRLPFILFGTLGIIWAIVFAMWFRDDPAKHRAVNDGERRLLEENSHATTHHEPIPWRAVLRNRNVWLLGTITTCAAFTFYLYYSWYPKYLHAARDVGMIEAGWLTSLVLGGGMFGTVAGGLIADRFIQRSQSPMRWRRYFCFICFALAGLFLLFSFLVDSSHLSAGLVFVSCLTMSCQQSSWWSSVSELSGRHIGVLFGLMNSLGIPGAMASQYYFGASADWREAAGFTGRAQWDPAFLAYLCLLWTAAVCWLFVDSTSPITAKNAPPSVNAEEKCQLCST